MRDGVFLLTKEPFNIQTVIKSVCEIFNPQASARNIAISFQTDRTSDDSKEIPALQGDKRRFKQVLMNLIKNALKFTMKGKIDIKASYVLN